MEQFSMTFTSNTGLLVQYGDTKVLFDSLYGKSGHRFSPLPQFLEQEIMAGEGDFSHIDYLVFSHNHADHFSAKYLKAYLQQNTVKGIFLPEDLLLEMDLMAFLKAEKIPTMFFSKNPSLNRTIVLGKSFRMRAIPMCHQGEIYQDVPHFCFLLSCGTEHFLLTADVDFTKEDFSAFSKTDLDGVFVNPLFFHSKEGQQVIRETINPKEVFVYHIPFASDDVLSMRKMVKRDCDKWDACPVTPLWEPMQRECRTVDRG